MYSVKIWRIGHHRKKKIASGGGEIAGSLGATDSSVKRPAITL